MKSREMKLYGNRVYGKEVSSYGLENGYLDYYTLSRIVGDLILNNSVFNSGYPEDWELVNGEDYYEDENDYCHYDIYQFYIITHHGYEFLSEHTDEIVYYNDKLDIYLWGITHYGTGWDYVLTDIKLIDEDGKWIKEKSDIEDWSKCELKFRYMMLDRLRQDCDYYLRIGGSSNCLWAGNEKDQIENMKAIWNTFPEEDKPEWLTWDDILEFERKMVK